MGNEIRKPVVLVVAGPNGSGKSTIAQRLNPFLVYVNADDIKIECGLNDIGAAQHAELLRNELVENKRDFAFETVMSTDRNIRLLEKAKNYGYERCCIYVLTSNADINVARVKGRSESGGHDVPEVKIRSRYDRALALLPRLINICDKIQIYDNSDDSGVSLIFKKGFDRTEIFPNDYWSGAELQKLLGQA